MEITKETFEAMLILLFKIEEFEACDALMGVYKKVFFQSPEVKETKLTLVKE